MADQPIQAPAVDPDAQVFLIQRMYLKDMSLEIPHAPKIFLEAGTPQVEISLDVSHSSLAPGVNEVVVMVTITTKLADKVMFLVEARQAGIFEMRNLPEEQIEMLLNVICANIVFPYLRSNVADVIQRTGFPPIHLAEINFEALYQQRLAAQQPPVQH